MLTINKSRILKMPKQLALPTGEEIRIAIKATEAHKTRTFQEIGFKAPPKEGDTVLPTVVGAATRKNAKGYFILHKDREKVYRSFQIATRRSQFCGRDQREIVEDYCTYLRLCWQRTFVPPANVELTYMLGDDGDHYYVSSPFKWGEQDDKILMAINVFLDLFRCCHICEMRAGGFPSVAVRRVNWQLLPSGTRTSQKELDQLVASIPRKTQRTLAKRQFDSLHRFSPDSLAIGHGGFKGYVAFQFNTLGLTVLESIEPNNATYVFGEDWEQLSQMPKTEILNNDLAHTRVIHKQDWYYKMQHILNVRKSA